MPIKPFLIILNPIDPSLKVLIFDPQPLKTHNLPGATVRGSRWQFYPDLIIQRARRAQRAKWSPSAMDKLSSVRRSLPPLPKH
ncbi:hypothetical protein XELAEV_18025906mg [Xenopus laevis]|uniref:Uncharacterized protein n=1 Tax=Xenopus laevis TaxID=8355 RepID=A0A974D389_XENLA|nr:hypothetical protein XELAEV_18025906mg [Xenopus laevis]